MISIRSTRWLASCLLAPAIFACAEFALAEPNNWPQWRGPHRAGVLKQPVSDNFASKELTPKWNVEIGAGYAGPAVAGGKVFVTDRPYGTELERAIALDAATGEESWQFTWPARYDQLDYASGPRATPTVDGDRVYVKGAMGALICLGTEDGQVIWRRDLVSDFNARIPTWGMVGAPLVDGDLVIVNVGGSPSAAVIAFDRRDGAVIWQQLGDRPGYAPPTIIEFAGKRQLIYWSAEAVNSLDPKTGQSYWRIPFTDRADMTICSPVLDDNQLFFSSYYGGSLMLRLTNELPSAEVVWRDQRGRPANLALCISTPIFKDQHLYGVDRSGLLKCLDADSGRVVWQTAAPTGNKNHANAHIIRNGDREILFNESGELIIARLSPSGYQELSRTRIISPTAGVKDHRAVDWSHPAFAYGHVFVRNDRELRCVPLEARQ